MRQRQGEAFQNQAKARQGTGRNFETEARPRQKLKTEAISNFYIM
jgi:hypothetical protein